MASNDPPETLVLHTDLLGRNLEALALDRLREYEPPEGYYLAFSGGKDSIVILDLAKRAGVKFDAHYNCTTVDPPEVMDFIRTFPEVEFHKPPRGMFSLIPEKGFPMRQARWCCNAMKEGTGLDAGRIIVTGVRWAESARRAQRRMFDACNRDRGGGFFLHPIIDWSHEDVWAYIRGHGVRYCSLYDEGWRRIGCVLCPFSRETEKERKRWPKFDRAYRLAFHRLWANRRATDPTWGDRWADADDMYEWWLRRDVKHEKGSRVEGQCVLFE
ncbi:MAG: phosphoadenosine phosphosulfate reductase family protein [Lentisphaerae bacterium]|nr:phosphoadenosine phosphosulfate reductase family protein [Lentisphaerota bacterium]